MTIFYYLKGSPSSRKHISEVVCWKYLLGNNCYQPFVVFQPLADCCSSAAHYILHELLLTWPNPTQTESLLTPPTHIVTVTTMC